MKREEWALVLSNIMSLETTKPKLQASVPAKMRAMAKTITWAFYGRREESFRRHETQKQAIYMSLEYLMGKSLHNHLHALGEETEAVVSELVEELYGVHVEELYSQEPDAGLGNGGLGRLAACLMEGAATRDIPLRGYGLRYEKGIFTQQFKNGFQVEEGDQWLRAGDPWGIRNEEETLLIDIGTEKIKAVPYDYVVPGYESRNVNRLRLWQAEALNDFDFDLFNNFQYEMAVGNRNSAANITRVLYPNDEKYEGKVLRFKQQYFFAQATIADIYRSLKAQGRDLSRWGDYYAIQLNDTHPVIAIAETIRLLTEKEGFTLEEAMDTASQIFHYTNHTILKEAMETWDVAILQEVCQRTLHIIEGMDQHFRMKWQEQGLSEEQIRRISIIEDGYVRMAHLGIHMSSHVNGVAKLHTEILKNHELKDFADLYPQRFLNISNGVSPRRFLFLANQELSRAADGWIGRQWREDLSQLEALKDQISDEMLDEFMAIKRRNKERLARAIKEKMGIEINPESLFDIHIKRIHEYKRQLMFALSIWHKYQELKANPQLDFVPHTYIFGGKAAPGYHRAKGIIKYINELARVINDDPAMEGRLKVVYIENYDVSWAELLVSAADLSEQISTAGKEASGTGNMKFMMNGTITLGTRDGANIEIFEAAGEENNYVFGATFEELQALEYHPEQMKEEPLIKEALDSLMNSPLDDNDSMKFLDLYHALVDNGMNRNDEYYVLYDLPEYIEVKDRIAEDFKDQRTWARKSLMNFASCGHFSIDRTIEEYAREIWKVSWNSEKK
ncbi:MAG: glycogen/starch/alpha-glucan phosphorylase [Tissierellia bacterium]|nr:glycogen/starch/alpha-glucan phosphorylase [Tissierellia bacterium]